MIARDEEKLLPDCLASVRDEVDEIILVDTGSRDGTAELARSLGARVYSFRWRQDFAAARNASLERATGDWILMLDCDERLDPASRGLLRQAAASGRHDGYLVHLVNLPGGAEQWLALRLFRNRPGVRYQGRIHEQLRFTGSAAPCDATIHHLGYQPGVIAERDKQARNRDLVEAACAETAGGDPAQHSFYLFYRAFGAAGPERTTRLAEWVHYVEAHPELERPPALPWIPVGLAHYAWHLSDAGAHAEAQARARRLVERHGESPLLHLILARAYATAGDFTEAERSLARLETAGIATPYQYFPTDYALIRRRGHRLTAEIHERKGRLPEAERVYRRLLDADPSDLPSALRLTCVLVQMGACRPALDTLEAFPALLDQGLPEIDCLGLVLALILQSPSQIKWSSRVRASPTPLAARTLHRVSQRQPGVPFQLSDFPELVAGVQLTDS